ncbi:hypothetical protein ACLI1A_02930 [Flavobacterium sp. RHBU_3]|uniref:hypothetical protein n=1 Tax=Flavobacterium sp. RHBU_3 TaxID=3391184 RepID=UPI00398486E5
MKTWQPIPLEALNANISKAVANMSITELALWHYIKITPEKWQETEYGNEGSGFWVVGIFGRQVLWYNDIEEGFNVSSYSKYGEIGTYACEQDELNTVVYRLYEDIKTGKVFFNLPPSGIIGSDF